MVGVLVGKDQCLQVAQVTPCSDKLHEGVWPEVDLQVIVDNRARAAPQVGSAAPSRFLTRLTPTERRGPSFCRRRSKYSQSHTDSFPKRVGTSFTRERLNGS